MLKYPCLVLDHDDTVVQSETTINYPFFCYILDQFRPGQTITQEEYTNGCFSPGFVQMCRERYQFTDQELKDEYQQWMNFVMSHTPDPFPGIRELIHRYKQAGGILCVVSHSSIINITRDYQTHFGILPDDIYGWDLPENQRKPSTYPLEQIMKKYNLRPDQLLVVDDLKPAWVMCKNAGVPIAFAAWSKKNCPAILNEMTELCDFTFYSPEELEALLFQ